MSAPQHPTGPTAITDPDLDVSTVTHQAPGGGSSNPGTGGGDGESWEEIDAATANIEEQLLALFGDDEVRIAAANDLLDRLGELRRAKVRVIRQKAEAKTTDRLRERARREALGQFAGRPNAHVLKAENALKKVGLYDNAPTARQREFDEALWRLNVAHGYALARALDGNQVLTGFRAQVVAALREWAAEAVMPDRAAAFRSAADRVAHLLPTPVPDPVADRDTECDQ